MISELVRTRLLMICLFHVIARTGPIIVNATAEMLKEQFLPVAMKLKANAKEMEKEEIQFLAEKRRRQHQGGENSEREEMVKEVDKQICFEK